MTTEQLQEMLKKLLFRSTSNKVNWQYNHKARNFGVVFNSSTGIWIVYQTPESEPDWARADLYANGVSAATIFTDDERNENFLLIKQLYNDAERCYFGLDAAVEAINSALASDDVVGVPEDRPEEIPF